MQHEMRPTIDDRAGGVRDTQATEQVSEAIAAFNAQLLDALVQRAQSDSENFPFPDPIKSLLLTLSDVQRLEVARSGVLLADAEFGDADRWRNTDWVRDGDRYDCVRQGWLPREESVVLTYSVLTVAWYVVHSVPSAAGILLGMPEAVRNEFRVLGLGQLAIMARNRTNSVRPRWLNRPEVWVQLLTGIPRIEIGLAKSIPLQCLTVSAATAPNLLASLSEAM